MPLPKVLSGKRRHNFGYLVANGVAQAGTAVLTALLVKRGFDNLVLSNTATDFASTGVFAAGLTLCIIATAWLRWRSQVDAEELGQSYIHSVRLTLFRHIAMIGAEGARQMSRGAIVLRFVGDLTALRQWVSLGLARLTVSGLAAFLAIVALSFVEPVVAMAVAVAVTVAFVLAFLIGPHLRVQTRETRRCRGRLAAMLNDRVSHIGVVEAFGQEDRERQRFRRLSQRLRLAMIGRARVVGLLRALSEASGSLASACALFVGAVQVSMGHASPGAVVAAMVVAGLLAPRLQDLGRVYEYWNGAIIAREKQERLLALPSVGRGHRDDAGASLSDGPGQVVLKDVSFGHTLDEVNLSIAPGERIAITGPNGAGKSTLLRVIAGIYEPECGNVLLDGENLKDASWEDIRSAFAIVSPDLPLLRGSLRFNLKYGAEERTEEEILDVVSKLGLDELINGLPKGLKTRVSEKGEGFSTGERARIALARALLVRPRVLLLDEADANLDPGASGLLDQILENAGCTVIYITHDPARAAAADRVLRLEDGKLAAMDAEAVKSLAAPEPPLRLVT